MAMVGLADFVETLPPQLKIAVALFMHKKTFTTHPFFKELGNQRLLSFIGSRFRPQFFNTGQYLYRQGDEITTFKVVTKGVAAFVNPRYLNEMFAVIDPTMQETRLNS
jgi:hypothetical protein